MNQRTIIWSSAAALVLTLASIFFLDQPLAALAQSAGGRDSAFFKQGTHWLEIASGFPIDRYFLTYLLFGVSVLLFLWKSTRSAAWMILFIASAQIVTRLTAGSLKNVFHRLRPFEVIEAGNWDWNFFGDRGSSFPSGHGAHFWGLFFPLAFLFPRYRFPFAILPVFISMARVAVNDHWCSDVIASAGIAALITLLFIWLFRFKPVRTGDTASTGAVDAASQS